MQFQGRIQPNPYNQYLRGYLNNNKTQKILLWSKYIN